ncbi:hypothetical protein B0T25DRAFT_143082 [Lasiosphaeria hispida]|uniref:Uncharacterized protein n=1 Tax=Lasiosphaeria hispida TaxID=260671 RepID=A0AAJ0MFR6_9PEZI|nr:hypothetical protein B0T25DRAFT_143082 [Lasiosphaeria hispida]
MTDSPQSPRANGVATPAGVKSMGLSTGSDAPPASRPHPLRRAVTVDEAAYGARWRPSSDNLGSPKPPEDHRRRSSTFSDYSLAEARRGLQDDILNPGGVDLQSHEKKWSWLPLLFALLPPFGGILHKNGSAVITDLMLLGLAAVFLNWSVTQPWTWYHAAQEVRVREEMVVEMALEDDSDAGGGKGLSTRKLGDLDDVPEEQQEASRASTSTTSRFERGEQARHALTELYLHEIFALLMCFTAPVVGAYLLHAIRNQLSRPSEGLVSNYNLTIFILAAEIGPLSHLIRLVQARTLHLQRIVNSNPYREELVTPSQIHSLARRLESVETRITTPPSSSSSSLSPTTNPQNGHSDPTQPLRHQAKLEAALVRDVRNAIQPELDALNRAVRRYEKKATVLASLTDARLGALDTRLDDAVSLAAAAVKMGAAASSAGSFRWQYWIWALLGGLMERVLWVAVMPVHALLGVVMMPLRVLVGGRRRKVENGRYYREGDGRRRGQVRAGSVPRGMKR